MNYLVEELTKNVCCLGLSQRSEYVKNQEKILLSWVIPAQAGIHAVKYFYKEGAALYVLVLVKFQ